MGEARIVDGEPDVTVEQVAGWFKEASVSPHRNSRKAALKLDALAKEPQMQSFAKTVNVWRRHVHRPRDQLADCKTYDDLGKYKEVQIALRDLRDSLPKLLEIYQIEEGPESPPVQCLTRLIEAAEAASRYVLEPRPPGRPTKPWQIIADALVDPIERIWKSIGRMRVSRKAEGPLVNVMRYALRAIDGEEHDNEAIASSLKRHAAKKAAEIVKI